MIILNRRCTNRLTPPRVLSLLLLVCLSFSGPLSAQVSAEKSSSLSAEADSPQNAEQSSANEAPQISRQEQRALAYVEAFNSGNSEAYASWVQEHRSDTNTGNNSSAARADDFPALQKRYGSFEVHGAMLPSESETRLLILTRNTNEQLELIFQHNPSDDFRITTIDYLPFAIQADVQPDWQDLAELLSAYQQATGVPAWAAAVVQHGKIVDQAVAGSTASVDGQKLSAEISQFHWGSVTKSVTGTMLGGLIEQGKLQWDTTIGEIFNDIPVLEAYKSVTISELMAHRSGIPPYEDFEMAFVEALRDQAPASTQAQRQAWVENVLTQDAPIFTPGSDHRYSNAGITVAGVIAERVTGKSWEALVQEYVFAGLGMRNAGFGWPAAEGDATQPSGHFGSDPDSLEITPAELMQDLVEILGPAGNVRSSIEDMARYALLHLNGMAGKAGPLQADTIKKLHTALPAELERTEPYAFGWGQVTLQDGTRMHWHNGGAGSFYAEIRLFPEQQLGIVIMANAGFAERAIEPLWQAIWQRYAQQ